MAIKTYVENGKKLFEVYVNGFDARGRRFQRRKTKVETLKKAETLEFEFKVELAKLRDEKYPFKWSMWLEECCRIMKFDKRPSTIMNYERYLNKWATPAFRDKFIADITKSHVYSVVFEQVDQSLTPFSRRTILRLMSRIFQMAVEEGILTRNPCVGVKVKVPEAVQKVLTNAEVEIFLREAKLSGHKFYPVWLLALKTGMRSGKMFALKWTDIDFDARLISVTKQWTSKNGYGPTKTQQNRIVPISEDLLSFLKERKMEHGTKNEFVLPRLRDCDQGAQARITRDFCRFLGITSVKFHDLRATFITNLLARGEPLAKVMAIVGHSELKTTNGYLRKSGVEVQGGTDRLGYKVPQEEPAQIQEFTKGGRS